MLCLCNIANVAKNIQDHSKIDHVDMAIYLYDKNIHRLRVSKLPCGRYLVMFHKVAADFVYDNLILSYVILLHV